MMKHEWFDCWHHTDHPEEVAPVGFGGGPPSPLVGAVAEGNVALVRQLVALPGAEVARVDGARPMRPIPGLRGQYYPASPGLAPLDIAVMNGHAEVAEVLLRAGADPERWGPLGTPLYVAALNGRTAVVRTLLAAGASVNARYRGAQTALFAASHGWYADSVDCARLLIAAGARVDACPDDGRTPLALALERGCGPLIRTLLLSGASRAALSDECAPGECRSARAQLAAFLDRYPWAMTVENGQV